MATIHWRAGISGPFTDAFDWSTNAVPGAGDDVAIDAAGTYTVTVSATRTIRTLRTASTATLAVAGGRFTISNGTGTGANAGTISVANGAALAIGGSFDNSGRILLSSTNRVTDLVILSNVTLTGGGRVVLSSGGTLGAIGHSAIIGNGPTNPLVRPVTLTNATDTISGGGSIGGQNLVLVNDATIDGNSRSVALTLDTSTHRISNSGLIEGATAQGMVVVSDVANNGEMEAAGPSARLRLDGTVANSAHGSVSTTGTGAHVDLDSAAITGGSVIVGSGGIVQSLAGSGLSTISGAAVSGTGTLQANHDSTLSVTNSTIAPTTALVSNGIGSVLSVDGTVGALAGTINSGEIEFKGASAANVSFAPGAVGTLKLDSTFTGTVSGLAGAIPMTFTNFFAFGDSTIDSGALQYLSPDLPSPPNPGITDRLQNALAAGGTNSPVGVGLMSSQLLAADFGIAANTAYTTGGVVGGGTNYAIAGALDAADAGSGNDPGNGSVSNINQAGKPNPDPALLSTVAQLESYLNSVGGVADASALYLVGSGGNDFSYANRFITDPTQQQAYLSAQAQSLATEIEKLYADGARHIVVNGAQNNNNHSLELFYTQQLFADLDASGIAYTKSDIHAMVQDVIADPTAYGFTSTTVHPGVVGLQTESALVEPDTVNGLSGWGLWGANTTTPDTGQQLNHQYAYLAVADAEQTHFFADDQHLSAAGQQMEANLDRNLITDDAIDLTSLPYEFGQTSAGFSGTSAGGTLTVSNGQQSVNIALLGNYMAAAFVTASDGTGGTLVMDQTSATPPQLLTAAHG